MSKFLVYGITQLRSIFGIAVFVPLTMLFSIICIVTGLLGLRTTTTEFIWLWAKLVLFAFGIRTRVTGEENLPSSGGGIVVFNHQSYFDIPVLMSTTHKHIRFGAKAELFRIPFFGAAMTAVGTLQITRDNRSKVMQIYKQAERHFKNGLIFVLAPEGTRQLEPVIGRFKKGPFTFAIDAQVPLIPTVIKGAHAVLPKRSLNVNVGQLSRTVEVHFLPAVATVDRKAVDVNAVTAEIQSQMMKEYQREPDSTASSTRRPDLP